MKENLKAFDSISFNSGKGLTESVLPDVNMHFQLFDSTGNLTFELFTHNAVTALGKELIADQLVFAPVIAKPTHVGLGTGVPGVLTLGNEFSGGGYSRQGFTSKTRSGNTVTMVTNFPAGVATGAITEAGTFNAVTGGTMMLVAQFATINKGPADLLTLTWTITIT